MTIQEVNQEVLITPLFSNVYEIVPDLSSAQKKEILEKNYFKAESEPLQLRLFFLFYHNPECFNDDDCDEIFENILSTEFLERLIFSRVREKYEGTRFEDITNEGFRDLSSKATVVVLWLFAMYIINVTNAATMKTLVSINAKNGYNINPQVFRNTLGTFLKKKLGERAGEAVETFSTGSTDFTVTAGHPSYKSNDETASWANEPNNVIHAVNETIYNEFIRRQGSVSEKKLADSITLTYSTIQFLTLFCYWYKIEDVSQVVKSQVVKYLSSEEMNRILGFGLVSDLLRLGVFDYGKISKDHIKLLTNPSEFRGHVRKALLNDRIFLTRDLFNPVTKGRQTRHIVNSEKFKGGGKIMAAIDLLEYAVDGPFKATLRLAKMPKGYRVYELVANLRNMMLFNFVHVTSLPAVKQGTLNFINPEREYTYYQWFILVPKWLGYAASRTQYGKKLAKKKFATELAIGTAYMIDQLSTKIATNGDFQDNLNKFYRDQSKLVNNKATRFEGHRKRLQSGFALTYYDCMVMATQIQRNMVQVFVNLGIDFITWIATRPATWILVTLYGMKVIFAPKFFYFGLQFIMTAFKDITLNVIGLKEYVIGLKDYKLSPECAANAKWAKLHEDEIAVSKYIGDWSEYKRNLS